MFSTLINDIKQEYRYGNIVTRLIIANVGIFIIVLLFKLVFRIVGGFENPLPLAFEKTLHLLMVSSAGLENLRHFWSFISYMFLHEGAWHLLWNMLYLYWFGNIFRDLIGNQRVFPVYLMGGIMGAFFFFALINIIGTETTTYLLGASAAVLAIAVAAATIAPNYSVELLFFGAVKLKYIIMIAILLDLIGIAENINTGGHFAHIGGIFMGYFFAKQLQNGRDLSLVFQNIGAWFKKIGQRISGIKQQRNKNAFKKKHTTSTSDQQVPTRASDTENNFNTEWQQKIDAILDKIKQLGYESLTPEEKQILFNASKKKD